MKIKVRVGNELSGWEKHTTSKHLEMKKNPPQSVVIQISDFYQDSPDNRIEVEISFELFDTLAREFTLIRNRQKKKDSRHRTDKPLHKVFYNGDIPCGHLEDDFDRYDFDKQFAAALENLTVVQRRRFIQHFVFGISERGIARREGVRLQAVQQSVDAAKIKLKKLFE